MSQVSQSLGLSIYKRCLTDQGEIKLRRCESGVKFRTSTIAQVVFYEGLMFTWKFTLHSISCFISGPLLKSKFRAYKMTRENMEMPINAVTYAVDADVKYSRH